MSAIASGTPLAQTGGRRRGRLDALTDHMLVSFYHFVQLSLLFASIPNVAAFWGAYESQAIPGGGFSIAHLFTIGDFRNAFVGIMIDACVYVTSIAALRRLQRGVPSRWALLPHFTIMLICGGISFVANWETVSLAAHRTAYASFTVQTFWGAVVVGLVNTLIVSSAPLLAVVMVWLAPSIVERAPEMTAEEIEEANRREIARKRAENELKAETLRSRVAVEQAKGQVNEAKVTAVARAGRAGVMAALDRRDSQPKLPTAIETTVTGERPVTKTANQTAQRPNGPEDDDDPTPPRGRRYPTNGTAADDGDDDDDKFASDWAATRPHRSVGARNENRAAPSASPSASQVSRKVDKAERSHSYNEAVERMRKTRELGGSDLEDILSISHTAAQRIMATVPGGRVIDNDGPRRKVVDVQHLINWFKTEHDGHYEAYGYRLETLLRGKTPKAKAPRNGNNNGNKGNSRHNWQLSETQEEAQSGGAVTLSRGDRGAGLRVTRPQLVAMPKLVAVPSSTPNGTSDVASDDAVTA